MKFRSILSFNSKLRTNLIFCLIFAILSALQTLVLSVRLMPQEKVKAIWNTQQLFVTCLRDPNQNDGSLKWFNREGREVPDSESKIYQQEMGNSVKLFIISAPKKHSGFYECRHIRDNKVVSSEKFELKIYNSINMEGNKDSYVGTEGGSFSMICLAKFDTEATEAQISWFYNNLQIKNKEGQFTITNRNEQSVDMRSTRSTLTIKNINKENEGMYLCQSEYGNPQMTDMKSIDINLRVQFKPRFPENTQKYVWISDSDSDQSQSPVTVTLTCLVNADPVAQFQWFTGHDIPIDKGIQTLNHKINNSENLSLLTIEYKSLNEIRNNFKSGDNLKKIQCKANNTIGEAKITFELNIGKLPETPLLVNNSYENGVITLIFNDTKVEPPIDRYRLDIADKHTVYFNTSNRNELSNNTYEIQVEVPKVPIGEHVLKIYAHNPVGWSEFSDYLIPQKLIINSASVVHQYIVYVLIASTLSLVNAF